MVLAVIDYWHSVNCDFWLFGLHDKNARAYLYGNLYVTDEFMPENED